MSASLIAKTAQQNSNEIEKKTRVKSRDGELGGGWSFLKFKNFELIEIKQNSTNRSSQNYTPLSITCTLQKDPN